MRTTLLALLALAACAAPPETAEDRRAREDLDLQVAAQAAIRQAARDPSSVQFEQVAVIRRSGGPVVCGLYNAKNGFGGYTGKTPFMSYGGTIYMPNRGLTPKAFKAKWEESC